MFNRVDQRQTRSGRQKKLRNRLSRQSTDELLETSESSYNEEAKLQMALEIEDVESMITQRKKVEQDIRDMNDNIELEEAEIKRLEIVKKKLERKSGGSGFSESIAINAKITSKKTDIAAMKKTRKKKIARARSLKDSVDSCK